MKLQSPTGVDILGTLETIPGVCPIVSEVVVKDGKYVFEVDGTTIEWDGQETVKALDQRVFVDCSGGQWIESQLVLVEDAEDLKGD